MAQDARAPGLPDGEPPELAVIVVTHNSAALVAECLGALEGAAQGVRSWELIVVDNASDDGTPALVRRLAPQATVVETGDNAGYAAGINVGLDRCPTAQHVLVLNPDVRLEPGSVLRLIDAVQRPGVGIAVPRLVDEAGRLQLSLRREPTLARALAEAVLGGTRASTTGRLGEVIGTPGDYEAERPVDWATGAVMLISRRCLDTVGAWDDSFFLYSEETDFALRGRDQGLRTWYTPAATAVHLGGESNTSPWLWSILTVNRVRLYAKRHGPVATGAFRLAVLVNEALRAATGSKTHRAGLRALLGRAPARPPRSSAAPEDGPGWICFSSVDWWYFNRAHSDIQLMRRIARRRPVLFVNSIGMRMPLPGRSSEFSRRILRKVRSVLRSVQQPVDDLPNFHVVTPVILPFYGSAAMRWLNERLIRTQIRRIARRVGIDPDAAVVFLAVPTAWEVVEPMTTRAVLYNRSDFHSAFEETDQDYIRGLEDQLFSRADAVLYVSHALMEAEHHKVAERGVFLDHGVDLERFGPDDAAEPADLAAIAHPRIGFFGAVDDYTVDLDLLVQVAESFPDASLVLVGGATCSMERLEALPNVHWLGFRPYEQIPAYGRGFDVALMPWLRNEWITHSNPIKMKEYLALGLPVVSTDFPEVHHYRDVVAVATDPDDFVRLVGDALAGHETGTTESRQQRVADASWDQRADDLLGIGEGIVR